MSPEDRVPAEHPLRAIKKLADEALASLSSVFDAMYAGTGRPSIPPERLLKSTLLMALYTVRSERQFCEQLDYNLLFRWFLDMDMVEESFVPTVFTKNRDRLLAHDVAGEFFRAVVAQARSAKLMSSEHFTVDGTLIESWASLKSFKKTGDNDKTPPERHRQGGEDVLLRTCVDGESQRPHRGSPSRSRGRSRRGATRSRCSTRTCQVGAA